MIDELCSHWVEPVFCGGARKAFQNLVGGQQLGAQRVGPGSSARPGHVQTGDRPFRCRLQHLPDWAEPVPAPGNPVPSVKVCPEISIQPLPRWNSPEVSTAVVAVSLNQTGCQ